MLKNKQVLELMKKEFPVKGKKKWKLEWYEPGYHKVVKELFKNDVDPVILEELKRDKELKLTMKKLEIEPSLLWVQFWKDLEPELTKAIRQQAVTGPMNDICDKKFTFKMERESDKNYQSGLNLIKYLMVKAERTPKKIATFFVRLFMILLVILYIVQ
jgi:hypothetical protein